MDSSHPLCFRFPRLFSYVVDDKLTVAEVYMTTDRTSLFHLPMSSQAYEEFGLLQDALLANPLSAEPDNWAYGWGQTYKSGQYYSLIHSHILVPTIYKWIWKSSCIMRTKVFAWLLLSDRLNTRDLLKCHHWNVTDDTHCVLCVAHAYEERFHLFFTCNFSQRIWNYLQIDWSLGDDIQSATSAARREFGMPFFTEVVILVYWHIWKLRNGIFFSRNTQPLANGSVILFMTFLCLGIELKLNIVMFSWLGLM